MLNAYKEKRNATRFPVKILATTNTVPRKWGWAHPIESGGAVITDCSARGLQMSLDIALGIGEAVQVVVPSDQEGGADVTLTGTVAWRRRNALSIFGRHTCGLSFHPADQAAVESLLAEREPSTAAAPAPT